MGNILFQLTDEIIDLIIFGMENQADDYYVNTESGKVGTKDDLLQDSNGSEIEDIAVPVPEWYSSDGFQLMESFLVQIHNPVHIKVLGDILTAGRGAFKNFKNYVKASEPLARQWYQHKERVMYARVEDWYNTHSQILKYQRINENTDDTDILLLDDFVVSTDCARWENLINKNGELSIRESLESGKSCLADLFIYRNNLLSEDPDFIPFSVCAETIDGEYAGSVTGGSLSLTGNNSGIGIVSTIWVERQFRDMGLARYMIDKLLKEMKGSGIESVVFDLPGTGINLEPTLVERGGEVVLTTMEVIDPVV